MDDGGQLQRVWDTAHSRPVQRRAEGRDCTVLCALSRGMHPLLDVHHRGLHTNSIMHRQGGIHGLLVSASNLRQAGSAIVHHLGAYAVSLGSHARSAFGEPQHA